MTVLLSKNPTTSCRIKNELSDITGTVIPGRTIRHELNRMEMKYTRGIKSDPRANNPGNVAFRMGYLANKVSNLNVNMKPKVPEVFLDKSYCNENHVAGKTSLSKDSPRYLPSGSGKRFCIVGASVIYTNHGWL